MGGFVEILRGDDEIEAMFLWSHAESGIARFVSGFGVSKEKRRSLRCALVDFDR
jgi:hypothetical protein